MINTTELREWAANRMYYGDKESHEKLTQAAKEIDHFRSALEDAASELAERGAYEAANRIHRVIVGVE